RELVKEVRAGPVACDEWVHAIAVGVEVDGHEGVGILPTRNDRTEPKVNGVVRGSRHHHLGAALLEELTHLLAHGQHGHSLVETCRTGRADGRMAGINGDREAAQRTVSRYDGAAANAQYKIAVLP